MTGIRARRATQDNVWYDDIHAVDERPSVGWHMVFNVVTVTMLLFVVGLIALVAVLWPAP